MLDRIMSFARNTGHTAPKPSAVVASQPSAPQTLWTAMGAVGVLAVLLATLSCSEYRFEPTTDIGVNPSSLRFRSQKRNGQAQELYILNSALTARLQIYEAKFVDPSKVDPITKVARPMVPKNPSGGDLPEYPLPNGKKLSLNGFWADYDENLTFSLRIDHNLLYQARNTARPAAGDNDNFQLRNPANAVRFCAADPAGQAFAWAKCTGDACACADTEALYDRAGKLGRDLTGLNICDQLALTRALAPLTDGREDVPARLTANRLASHLPLFSTLVSYSATAQIRTGERSDSSALLSRPAQLKLEQPAFIRQKIAEGLNPFVILDNGTQTKADDLVVVDWDIAAQICAPNGQFDPSLLSIDPCNATDTCEDRSLQVKLETLALLARFQYSPRLPDGKDFHCLLNMPSAPGAGPATCDANGQVDRATVATKDVLQNKQFRITILSNDFKQPARDVDIFLSSESAGPPIPVIDELTGVEPLDTKIVSGCSSYSPLGASREPLQYQWRIETSPPSATDFYCIDPRGDFENPTPWLVTDKEWSPICGPKCYFPVPGTYKISLRVKDNQNLESDERAEVEIVVTPKDALFVQLSWDKGGDRNRGVDLDMFLVRDRADGTFGVQSAAQDAVRNVSVPNPPAGLSCSDDAACRTSHPAYYCRSGTCAKRSEWWCCDPANIIVDEQGNTVGRCRDGAGSDANCSFGGTQYFCNAVAPREADSKLVCTKYGYDALNDTCWTNQRGPDWGQRMSPTTGTDGTLDNPRLDIDDVDGYGPEQITVEKPAAGKYRVVVRLYSDSAQAVSFSDPVTAFVRVYVRGEQCFKRDIVLPLTDEIPTCIRAPCNSLFVYWKVIDIDWAGDERENCATTVGTSLDTADNKLVPLDPPDARTVDKQCLDEDDERCRFANPFAMRLPLPMDPKEADPNRGGARSVWCDSASSSRCPACIGASSRHCRP